MDVAVVPGSPQLAGLLGLHDLLGDDGLRFLDEIPEVSEVARRAPHARVARLRDDWIVDVLSLLCFS